MKTWILPICISILSLSCEDQLQRKDGYDFKIKHIEQSNSQILGKYHYTIMRYEGFQRVGSLEVYSDSLLTMDDTFELIIKRKK